MVSKAPQVEEFVAEFLAARQEGSVAYEPREDTFLMLEPLADLPLQGLRVLDVGTGSGILAAYCANKRADVTASDIDAGAIEELKSLAGRLGITLKLISCDLFSRIDGRFDIIVFNPPYLPSPKFDDRTVDGGKHGTVVINRFLDQLGPHLAEDGFGLILTSSLNGPEQLEMSHPDLSFETLRQQSLFFETLYVLKVRKKRTTARRR
ncbi:methyltransferase [Candidatus Bathyarchaeota archaeon]|jgi:release factor glutamine methyltransferase|nr:methyltransferase [Candidatus Bathyarchaeota archaeon]